MKQKIPFLSFVVFASQRAKGLGSLGAKTFTTALTPKMSELKSGFYTPTFTPTLTTSSFVFWELSFTPTLIPISNPFTLYTLYTSNPILIPILILLVPTFTPTLSQRSLFIIKFNLIYLHSHSYSLCCKLNMILQFMYVEELSALQGGEKSSIS